MATYTRNNLPPGEEFGEFRKKVLTKARRMDGPFNVHTLEGELFCQDGWLAIDVRGWPYPIDHDEFELIYEPATAEPAAPG